MCYNHNYFYTKKIIILIRKFWQIASNIALLSASRRNKRKIQNSVILMSPCLRRRCLCQLATCSHFKCLCNSHISLVWEVFPPLPHFHFHRCFRGIQNKGTLSSSVSVPSAFL